MRGTFHRPECVQKEQRLRTFLGKLLDPLL